MYFYLFYSTHFQTKSIATGNSSLKWTDLPKLWKRRGTPTTPSKKVGLDAYPVPEQIVLEVQEIIAHHSMATNPMDRLAKIHAHTYAYIHTCTVMVYKHTHTHKHTRIGTGIHTYWVYTHTHTHTHTHTLWAFIHLSAHSVFHPDILARGGKIEF